MIATMSKTGVITLQAETSIEEFALDKWCGESFTAGSVQYAEDHMIRGSKLRVIASIAAGESSGAERAQ